MFRHVVSVPNTSKTALAWSFAAFGDGQLWIALITFLYLVGCSGLHLTIMPQPPGHKMMDLIAQQGVVLSEPACVVPGCILQASTAGPAPDA